MPKAVALLLACFVAAAHANPAARPRRDITALGGAWNGSHIEQRRSCRSVQNEGFHGTYAEYSIYVDPLSPALTITETAVTGLICNWSGQYRGDAGRTVISGSLSCSDGRTGTFQSEGFFVLDTLMSLRLSIQLTGSETCAVDAILSGAHF